jgi:tetratricopeptide (TPR) repeat protein
MTLKSILPVVLLTAVVATGCASGKKTPTQKEQATKQWNQARARVMFGLAKDQYSTGNFEPARKTCNEALRLDSESEPLRILSAKLAVEAGNLDLADKELAEARKLNPKDAEADYLSGVVQQRWQAPEKALAFYTSASEKSTDEIAYVLARSEMLVALGRQEEALRMLEGKVVYFEHSAVIRDAVGQLLVQFARYKEAADMLREASILAGNDLGITEHLAFALLLSGQHREAIEPFQKLLRDEKYAKRGDLYLALGQCLMETGKVRDAKQKFETAAQLDPQSASAFLALGRAALQQNDLNRADTSLRRAVSLDPARSETRLLMGYLKLKQNKLQDALTNFQRASALDRNDTVSLCMVGYTLSKLGRNEQALQYYAQALKIKPGDEMASRMMAAMDLRD